MLDYGKLKQAVGDLDEETALAMIDGVMADGGEDVGQAVLACQEGLEIVGDLFSEGTYFIGDLIFAGELMTEALKKMKSALASGSGDQNKAKMILCTVAGDLHDIGKNIVKAFLEAAGFEVMDLGIDTPSEKIVDTAVQEGIKIIALSGVLTLAVDSMKEVVNICTARNIRDQVRIVVGGNPVSPEVCEFVGADAWAHAPQDTVSACNSWI